ncbi:MAG: peptide MFS transporter [bacterium]|nr:peptide MFS transporter [bacterium]
MLKGHPKGLFALFLTEMWERLSFYMLLGILVLYASDVERGGLGLTLAEASGIYGTYLAFVYFTPFLGGIIADKWLGYRKSVFIGGILMSAGLFLLGTPGLPYLYLGLAFICVGNGFFKPNISAMVGNLYKPGDPKRDTGFNIFYMGINIGAAIANLAAAPIRNMFSWKWAFYTAGVGLIIAVVILVINWKKLEVADRPHEAGPEDVTLATIFGKILLPAAIFAVIGFTLAKFLLPLDHPVTPTLAGFLLGMVPILYFLFSTARNASPAEKPGLMALLPVFVAGATFFMILHLNGSALTIWAKDSTDRQVASVPQLWQQDAMPSYYENADKDVPRPRERTLLVVDDVTAKMFGTKKMTEEYFAKVTAMGDVEPVNVWTREGGAVEKEFPEVWKLLATFVYNNHDVNVKTEGSGSVDLKPGVTPLRKVTFVRTIDGKKVPLNMLPQKVFDDVYKNASEKRLPPGEFNRVVSPEVYQVWNPLFVIILTPLIVMFFAGRIKKSKPVSTARKIFYGMLLTAGAMLIMAIAGFMSDGGATKVAGMWLIMTYAVITIGELCLSPMSLSLVTKLAPKRLVGLMMGGWFVSTAFGNKLSGFFGSIQESLAPSVFFLILTACALAVAMFIYFLLNMLESAISKYDA